MKSSRALLELHTAVALFGVAGLFGKLVEVSSSLLVFGRSSTAAIAIALLLIWQGRSLLPGQRHSILLIASGLLLAVHWLTFFHAIQTSSVAIGLVGFATFPLFVTLLEPLGFGGKWRHRDWLTALLVLIGLFLVAPEFNLDNQATVALLWAVLSGFLFAILTLCSRKLVENQSVYVVSLWQHAISAVVMLPLAWHTLGEINAEQLGWLLILGTLCTALPHSLFIKALQTIKAHTASIIVGLEPVYGIVFAALFLGEIPTLTTLLGALIVLIAVGLAVHWQKMEGSEHSPQ